MSRTKQLYFSTKSWTTLYLWELEPLWWEYCNGREYRRERHESWRHNRLETRAVQQSRGRSRVTNHCLSDTCLGEKEHQENNLMKRKYFCCLLFEKNFSLLLIDHVFNYKSFCLSCHENNSNVVQVQCQILLTYLQISCIISGSGAGLMMLEYQFGPDRGCYHSTYQHLAVIWTKQSAQIWPVMIISVSSSGGD